MIRRYTDADWPTIEAVHDSARRVELALAGVEGAFIPLREAAGNEGLFEYQGLFVAEEQGEVVGFAACSEDELAWLYVAPGKTRRGIGRALAEYALKMFPGIRHIEALKGNEPARALYESLGFRLAEIKKGHMAGNETFEVEGYIFEKQESLD